MTRTVHLTVRQALLEQRSFWRSAEYALFTFAFPLMILLMMIGSGFVPCIGSIVQIAVTGPLVAAWYAYFLKHIRGQPAVLEDVFAVFSSSRTAG